MEILDLLGTYFDAVVVFVTNSSLLFRFAAPLFADFWYHEAFLLVIKLLQSRQGFSRKWSAIKWYYCTALPGSIYFNCLTVLIYALCLFQFIHCCICSWSHNYSFDFSRSSRKFHFHVLNHFVIQTPEWLEFKNK